jgi:MFS family permease
MSYWRLLRNNRDFRLLYLATLISLGGDWFLTVALLDLVLELTGSAALASGIIVCQTLPIFLTTPIAGHHIDKVDRRRLMIVVDLVRIGAALLPLLSRSPATLAFAYVGVIVISMGSAYFEPASHAALPNMVAEQDLAAANVLIGSTWGTMLAVGAGIGGLVTAQFGRSVSFIVDALTFLLSALLLMLIRSSFSEKSAPADHPPLMEAIRETAAYARANERVMALLSCKGGYGIGAGVVALVGVFGREVFQSGALGIGLLYAARGLGALLGPFLVRAVARTDEQLYRSIAAAIAIFGLGYIGLALSPSLLPGLIAVLVAHLGGGAQWQFSTYGLQREVPDRLRGRIFAADYGLVTLTMSISSIAAGVLADLWSARLATAIVASLCLIWGVVWGWWALRLWRREVP